MIKVGITGGIGSGKTTICKIFESFGIPVYYADDRAKALMQEDKKLRQDIMATFGNAVYDDMGNLNRQALASRVFSNKKNLTRLNSLVHPAVGRDYNQWLKSIDHAPYTLKEAALLVESGSFRALDCLIVVKAPEEVRINRVVDRDGVNPREVVKRMENQLHEEDKLKLADHVIDNDGSKLLIPQALEIHRTLSG